MSSWCLRMQRSMVIKRVLCAEQGFHVSWRNLLFDEKMTISRWMRRFRRRIRFFEKFNMIFPLVMSEMNRSCRRSRALSMKEMLFVVVRRISRFTLTNKTEIKFTHRARILHERSRESTSGYLDQRWSAEDCSYNPMISIDWLSARSISMNETVEVTRKESLRRSWKSNHLINGWDVPVEDWSKHRWPCPDSVWQHQYPTYSERTAQVHSVVTVGQLDYVQMPDRKPRRCT